ncbi:MAG: hypothetical protein M1818_002689 [Claussenomyces sp. TS43310]|nr:MAG: hypothetical protein M1818_002689 [Claussenomyces sp. TS43310]
MVWNFLASRAQLSGRPKATFFAILSLLAVFVTIAVLRLSDSPAHLRDITSSISQGLGNVLPASASDGVKPADAGAAASRPFKIGAKVAVIVETRPLTNLIPLILHFATVLGPEWPIMLFTLPTPTLPALGRSAAFQRAIARGQVSVVGVPADARFTTAETVSAFLASPWFWEQLAPAEHVLLFQSDSIVCANAPQRVEDFLAYDFVGAPISAEWGEGYNGGLSLRRWRTFSDVAHAHNFSQELADGLAGTPGAELTQVEDQWFYKKLKRLPPGADGTPAVNLPSPDVARRFAVETVYGDEPLGYHQVHRWNEGKEDEVERWCPEYRLATSDFIANHPPDEVGKRTGNVS